MFDYSFQKRVYLKQLLPVIQKMLQMLFAFICNLVVFAKAAVMLYRVGLPFFNCISM